METRIPTAASRAPKPWLELLVREHAASRVPITPGIVEGDGEPMESNTPVWIITERDTQSWGLRERGGMTWRLAGTAELAKLGAIDGGQPDLRARIKDRWRRECANR